MFNNAEQKGPKSHKVQPGAGGRFSEAPSTHLLRCLGGYHWVASHASQIGDSTENEQESQHLKVNSSVAFSTLTMLYNHLFQNIFITSKGDPDPISSQSPFPLLYPLAITNLLFVNGFAYSGHSTLKFCTVSNVGEGVPHTNNSPIPAGCPIIQPNFDTIYLETALCPIGSRPSPIRLPPPHPLLQMPIQSPGYLCF